MAKKKKHPEHENLERWLVSYADFITLLFATFTALYALAQSDAAKMKEVAKAIREGFQEQSIISGINSVLQGDSAPSHNPDPISSTQGAGQGLLEYDNMTYQAGEVKAAQETVEQLKQDIDKINREIAQENAKGSDAAGRHAPNLGEGEDDAPLRGVEVSVQERGLRISFDSRVLFQPGTAVLKRDSLKYLDKVVGRLKKFNATHVIHVEGHTDNQPIGTALYPSNWELSGARSSSVVRHLIRQHEFTPNGLVVVGYGSSMPLATNATAEGRAKNRRVDIIIYSRKVGDLINPRKQYAKEENLIRAEERGKDGEIIKVKDTPTNEPVRVIIQEKDGTERVIVPKKTAPAAPDHAPRMDKFDPKAKSADHGAH